MERQKLDVQNPENDKNPDACLVSPNAEIRISWSVLQWVSENQTSGLENRTKKRPVFERPRA